MPRALILSLLFSSACVGGADGDSAAGSSPAELSDCHASDGDPVDLGPLSVSGDTLSVEVSFGGGCESHDFAICWPDQAFMESEPVQARLEVWHDANRDGCEAYLTETLVVDLSPLREAWQDGYQRQSGTIIVRVGDEAVEYSF